MEVKNSVYPNEAQLKGFFEPGAEGPIFMVNLLKFKARAEYEDGRASDLTVLPYQCYSRSLVAAPYFQAPSNA